MQEYCERSIVVLREIVRWALRGANNSRCGPIKVKGGYELVKHSVTLHYFGFHLTPNSYILN